MSGGTCCSDSHFASRYNITPPTSRWVLGRSPQTAGGPGPPLKRTPPPPDHKSEELTVGFYFFAGWLRHWCLKGLETIHIDEGVGVEHLHHVGCAPIDGDGLGQTAIRS